MEVRDYVRTKSGGIGKTIEIDNNASFSHIITDNETFGLGWDGEQVNWDFITEIVKSSPNIIDLIEVKDIITFQCISNDYDFEYMKRYTNQINTNDELESFKEAVENEDLKLISIVTKEQFEAMEYRIGE